MGLMMAASLLLEAAVGWLTYEQNVADPRAVKFADFLQTKLSTGLMQRVEKLADEARRMTIERPDFPVYAILTYDLDYRWSRDASGAAGVPPHQLDFRDARVVDVTLGRHKVSKDVVLTKATDFRDRVDTRRVTVSLELNPLGESKAMHHWRVLLYEAGRAARQGISARKYVEGQHWDITLTPAEEREERRRAKFGMTKVIDERERQEQLAWVAAYIDHTAHHGPKKLYDEAIAYYKELEKRPLPNAGGCQHCSPPSGASGPQPMLVR
jgi:hypothetical protein